MPAIATTEITKIASTILALSSDATDATTESIADKTVVTTENIEDNPYLTDYPYFGYPNNNMGSGNNNIGSWYPTESPEYGYYYYYWDYSFYVLVGFMFFLILPLILIKMATNRKQQAARAAAIQQQRARRQVEINVTNTNSGNVGPPAPNSNTYDPNEISILPKNLDLPPAYDEIVLNSTKEQMQAAQMYSMPSGGAVHSPIRGAISTMTIETDLESSSNNLAAAATNAQDIEMGHKSVNVDEHSV